ncbi:hypothetical protein FB567DRAFT_530792 [Paraphoma chrysanthemicola]|uniref:Uncharacterized protein n=1 Tax=Paraphoma chrysanthemicola TaxID=798071 RepID=A0A8K0R1U4_9PLEO|nr:hypothetical protein FB567DRAFT_530792 [Paraphoma chrysanthemicola]
MAVDDELPWTTSRCNRLLRPLSSKLAKLRAEVERPRSAGTDSRNPSVAFATKCSPQKTTNFTRPALKPRGFDKAKDPDWRPGAKPGAGKKTYGGRGARKIAGIQRSAPDTGHVARPGEIAFTPLVARIGGQLQSSPHAQNSPLKKYGKNKGPLQVNIDWTQTPGDLRQLVRGISEAYANILQATVDGDEKSWKGTRSLMAACLRKLPAYIELEEHFAKLDREAEEDEERDIGSEIYEHLEAQFEQRLGQGWRPFKQVVRAHATSVLCDAVADGVLELDNMLLLVTHCVNVSAWDEAERLLIAYLPLLEPLSIPVNIKADLFDAQKSPFLCAIKKFVQCTGRYRLLYDLLEHLIANELLPLEWLATQAMRPVWDRLVRSASENDSKTIASTLRFFETVTIAGMGLPDERLLADETTGFRRFVPSSREDLRVALNTTYSSLLTVICSIALVNGGRDDDMGRNVALRIASLLKSVAVTIMSRNDIRSEIKLLEADKEDAQTFAQRATWAIFASLVAQLDISSTVGAELSLHAPELVQGMNWLATQYLPSGINTASILGSLPALLSSIARGTGRIWKDDGFEQVQRLVQTFMSMSGCRLPHKLWTLKRLALETAVEFAQDTGLVEHMTYAREIERKMRTQGRLVIVPSPQKNDSPSTNGGFRWEEGIGEWVACTPFIKQGVKQIQRQPVPVLELLPTPSQSDDEATMPGNYVDDNSIWDTTAFDHDEDDVPPQSSPIKRAPRRSVSSLGKRQRASSPMVVVSKRAHLTPPDTPVEFFPDLPEENASDDGPRRSRRSRTELKALAPRLRTQRSRQSLESGLRHQQRKTYVEKIEVDEHLSYSSQSDDGSPSSSSTSIDEVPKRRSTRTCASRSRARSSQSLPQYDGANDDEEQERDDLGITPARPITKRRTSSRNATKSQKEWWYATGVAGDSDESEDELSFQ